jgi:hypothetical protein
MKTCSNEGQRYEEENIRNIERLTRWKNKKIMIAMRRMKSNTNMLATMYRR